MARVLLALAAAALTAFSCAGGLLMVGESVQIGLITGAVAGLLAQSSVEAGIVAGVSALAAMAVEHRALQPMLASTAVVAVVEILASVVVAVWIVRTALARGRAARTAITLVVIALLVANMWATALISNGRPLEVAGGSHIAPLWQQLTGDDGHFAAFDQNGDSAWYYRVYTRMHAGAGYYPSFAYALTHDPNWAPTFVTQFKMPTLFWMWALLPSGQAIVIAFLILASIGVFLVLPISSGVDVPLVVPACAALASYFVFFATTPLVLSIEVWGVVFALASLAAAVMSYRANRWMLFAVATVALAAIAMLVRETLVFALVGGVLSAFVAREHRVFRAISWIVGAIAVAAAYAFHVAVTAKYEVPGPTQFAHGGIANVISAVTYATDMGGPRPVVYVLALLGLVGATALANPSLRVYALALTAMPLLAFFFLANQTTTDIGGLPINVWGVGVVPLIYALVPVGLSWLTGSPVGESLRLTGPTASR